MSFTTKRMELPGSLKPAMPLRMCSKCDRDRIPEGGIEMGPGRWICHACWNRKTSAWAHRRLAA